MNTEDVLLANNLSFDINSIEIFELENDDNKIILTFVEATRFIQEIEQLFRVYRSNLSLMLSTYILNSNDIIKRKIELYDNGWTDYSSINALTINLISAGKTLVEAIEVYLKAFYGKDSLEYIDFKRDCLNHEYDSHFGYRFLTRLRDFAQHGHLPVSIIDTEKGPQACFSIDRILPTPHFNHNESLMNEMKKIQKDIHDEYGDSAKIAYSLTVAQYNLSITTIYSSFYKTVKNGFFNIRNTVTTFLTKNPEAIIKSDTPLNGMVGYYDGSDDSLLHLFDPKADSCEMFLNFSRNADEILVQEVKEIEEFKSAFKWNAKTTNEG